MYKNFSFSKSNITLFAIVAIVGIFLLILILLSEDDRSRESFTPGLKMIYRPYIRSMRRYTTDTYKKMTDRTRIFLSKMKIL